MASLAGEAKTAARTPTLEEARANHPAGTAFIFPVEAGLRGLVLPMEMKRPTNHKKTRFINVTIVLDRSGSMGSHMKPLMSGLSLALKKLHPELKSHVVAFDNQVEIHKNIDSKMLPCLPVHARGCTYMAPTVQEVKKLLGPNSLVIVASDGEINDRAPLRSELARLGGADQVTVVGLRVGASPSADTEAISGWVTALGAQGALRTVPTVNPKVVSLALWECFKETRLQVTSQMHTLSCSGGVGKTRGVYTDECTVTPDGLLFLPVPDNLEDQAISLDGHPLRVVEIVPPRDHILAFIQQAFRNIKFAMVSGASDTEQRLGALLRILPKPVQDVWQFMTAAEIARRATEPKSDVKQLEQEIREAINQASVVSACSQQEKAEFICGKHAKTFTKRATEAGVKELVEAILKAAKYIEKRNLQSKISCFLSLENSYSSTFSAAGQLLNGFSPESVRDVLNLIGIVGLAVNLSPRSVIPDAWTLWGVIQEVHDGECSLSTSAYSQAVESGHAIEYPATHVLITGVVPIAEDTGSLEVLKILLPLLDTHAALCCFETTTTLPHMFTALLAETIIAYVKQLASSSKTELSDYSEKETSTLRSLCFTFNGLHQGSNFDEHCRATELLLSGAEDFSVTRLRVLARVISDEVLGRENVGTNWVTFKLYDLLMYRSVKRAAGRGELDRSKCLGHILLTECDRLLEGPFGYALHPFEEGPVEITDDMLRPIPMDSNAAHLTFDCRSFYTEHDAFLADINMVRALCALPPLRPDLVTSIVSLACKNESERPRIEGDRERLVRRTRLQLHQSWLQSLLSKKKIEEERIRFENLHRELLSARSIDEFDSLLLGKSSGGESKAGDGMPLMVSRQRIVNGENAFDKLVRALFAQVQSEEGPSNLAKSKLVFLITGRHVTEFHVEDPDDLSMKCFDADPSMAHYEQFLKPIVSADQFAKAKTFMKEAAYKRDGANRHGYGNANKSFFMLTGGISAGPDFKKHCRDNGNRVYGDPKKGFPTMYSCNSLRQFMLRDQRAFAQYLLDNVTKGNSGLWHPTFRKGKHAGNGNRIGKAFLPKGALHNRTDVLDMLEMVFIHNTMTHEEFHQAMISSHQKWIAKN